MKARLEFDFEEFSDKLSFKRACNADNAYLVLFDLFNVKFRQVTKYNMIGGETLNDTQAAIFAEFVSECYAVLNKYDVDLDDLE